MTYAVTSPDCHVTYVSLSPDCHVTFVDCTAPDDYRIGPYTVTFPAGVTMATISLWIEDDDLAEDTEQFSLKISSISDNRVVVGRENVSMVTILDGDSEWEGGV